MFNLKNGDPAPEIALTDVRGAAWKLSEQSGKMVILHFGRGEFCPTTRGEFALWNSFTHIFKKMNCELAFVVNGGRADGSYARHVRRMRLLYEQRQAALLAALTLHCAPWLEVAAHDAGMHLVGWLPRGIDDARVALAGRAAGLELAALSRQALAPMTRGGLMRGYAAFTPAVLARAAERLAQLLAREVPRRARRGRG